MTSDELITAIYSAHDDLLPMVEDALNARKAFPKRGKAGEQEGAVPRADEATKARPAASLNLKCHRTERWYDREASQYESYLSERSDPHNEPVVTLVGGHPLEVGEEYVVTFELAKNAS